MTIGSLNETCFASVITHFVREIYGDGHVLPTWIFCSEDLSVMDTDVLVSGCGQRDRDLSPRPRGCKVRRVNPLTRLTHREINSILIPVITRVYNYTTCTKAQFEFEFTACWKF